MKKIAFVFFVFISQLTLALDGVVIGVSDGDTITVLDSHKKQQKVRLSQIDAPEKGQPWGMNSKKALSDLVYKETVHVTVNGKDRYGRTIGTVFVNEVDVCKEQVKRGNAWVYIQYATDSALFELEKSARHNKTGLWQSGDAVAPWEWRIKNR